MFWFLFALALIVVALFPQVVYGLTGLLGMESPANFVFLCVLAIVVYRLLSLSVENARLRAKLTTLVQHVALEEFKGSADGEVPRASAAKAMFLGAARAFQGYTDIMSALRGGLL